MTVRPPVKNFFKIQEIADRLVVSTRTVRRWIHDGLLIAHRFHGVVRISEADFAAFLAARRDN
jgi:excisionase family DNA binding protein